jgi:hypothetical protein
MRLQQATMPHCWYKKETLRSNIYPLCCGAFLFVQVYPFTDF